jgi:hypothetical protein
MHERSIAYQVQILPVPVTCVERVGKTGWNEWRRITHFEPRVVIEAKYLRVCDGNVTIHILLVGLPAFKVRVFGC